MNLTAHYAVHIEDVCKALDHRDVSAAEGLIERIEELENEAGEALGTVGVVVGVMVAEAREAEGPRIIPMGAEATQADAENHDALVGAALDVLSTESHKARVLHLDLRLAARCPVGADFSQNFTP